MRRRSGGSRAPSRDRWSRRWRGAGPATSTGRPGRSSRLTAPGSFYLGVIALFPLLALTAIGVGQQFPFSGVSLLIMVGVGLDTVKQIESQLQQRNYEGFLR